MRRPAKLVARRRDEASVWYRWHWCRRRLQRRSRLLSGRGRGTRPGMGTFSRLILSFFLHWLRDGKPVLSSVAFLCFFLSFFFFFFLVFNFLFERVKKVYILLIFWICASILAAIFPTKRRYQWAFSMKVGLFFCPWRKCGPKEGPVSRAQSNEV
jgi:hypothetical protein